MPFLFLPRLLLFLLREPKSHAIGTASVSHTIQILRSRQIFITAFDLVTRMHEELDEDQEMITPYQFGLLMVDWTNPQKASSV